MEPSKCSLSSFESFFEVLLTGLKILLMICWLFVRFRFIVTFWMLIFHFKQFFSSKYFFSQLYSSKDGKFASLAELSEFVRNFFINIFKKKPKLFYLDLFIIIILWKRCCLLFWWALPKQFVVFSRNLSKTKTKILFFFQIWPKLGVYAICWILKLEYIKWVRNTFWYFKRLFLIEKIWKKVKQAPKRRKELQKVNSLKSSMYINQARSEYISEKQSTTQFTVYQFSISAIWCNRLLVRVLALVTATLS